MGVTGKWRCLLICCLLAVTARGHVVTQIFGEWKNADPWEIEVLFDAGYAVPEWRDDANTPAPSRQWLVEQGEAGWAPLKKEAERYLRESLALKSGGKPVAWQVEFIDFAKSPPDFPELLNDGAYFRMKLTADPSAVPSEMAWSNGQRPSFVLKLLGAEPAYLTLAPGESLPLAADRKNAALSTSWAEAFRQGFLHVLPKGLDHVLFVLGLFFYRREWRPLLCQSLAFTLAHTVTLGLAAAGVVRIPGNWVEPAIALSLVVIALENLRADRKANATMRMAIVTGFGLIHGLGFAGALSVWIRPGEGFLTALLSANLGVEIAQVAVLTGAWILTIHWHATRFYRATRLASCLAISGIGLCWAFERIFG
jgi:HupE / UreJ protein